MEVSTSIKWYSEDDFKIRIKLRLQIPKEKKMPTQNRILHVFLVTIIAFSFYLIPAHAPPIEQVSGDSPSSNSAPEGYVPQISEPQRLSVDAAAVVVPQTYCWYKLHFLGILMQTPKC